MNGITIVTLFCLGFGVFCMVCGVYDGDWLWAFEVMMRSMPRKYCPDPPPVAPRTPLKRGCNRTVLVVIGFFLVVLGVMALFPIRP